MNIMLCGASDIEEFLEPFKEIVYQFEGNPNCYIDGTIKYSNFKEWTDNSEESVRKSDIILFLIIKNFGEITWDIEYQMAKQIGKPFLIMCLDHTHNNYLSLDSNFKNSEEFQLKENKILTLIELLYQEKKSIAPFSKDFFKVIFKRQLSQIVTKAVEVLQKENQKTNLLKIIELKEDFKQEISTPSNRKYLMELLSDVFEKKEIRKQILECFCDNDNLKLTKIEIQNLVYDPEQGIQRRTVQLLPKLFNSDLNIEKGGCLKSAASFLCFFRYDLL